MRVRVEFRNGWCNLTLGQGDESVDLRATNLLDCFSDLVDCVADLCDGRLVTSLIWPAEPGGWLIDFAQLGYRRCVIDVFALADPNWITADEWRPRRGELVFAVSGSRDEVLMSTLAAVRTACTAPDARTGPGELSRTWGWPLPMERLVGAESSMRSRGYRPR